MADGAAYPWSAGFRTLAEEHDYRIDDIDGQVPTGLRGTLYRNGSGRNDLGGQWFPHWFDGDGMISAIRFDDRGIHYRNRYVATDNYRDETRAGHIVNRGFGKMRPGGVLANALRQPANVSNTSVVVRDGRLLSLWEGGPPFALDPATLETRGIETFGGTVKAFSAHPKVDPATGELFNFGIDYGASTHADPLPPRQGWPHKLPPVKLPYPVMNHDFVLTPGYLVFCIGPILVSPLRFHPGLQELRRRPELGRHAADPDPADTARRTRQAALHRDRRLLPVPLRQRLRGGRRAGPRLSRYPDYQTVGQALRDYYKSAWPSHGMASLTRMRIDLATGKVERKTYDSGTPTSPRASTRPIPAGASVMPTSPAIRPTARPGCSSSSRGSISRAARWHGTIFARAVIPASRSSSPRGRAAPRMTAWWSPWSSMPAVRLPTSSASTRATSRRDRSSWRRCKHPVPFSLHGTFAPAV